MFGRLICILADTIERGEEEVGKKKNIFMLIRKRI